MHFRYMQSGSTVAGKGQEQVAPGEAEDNGSSDPGIWAGGAGYG